LAIKKILPPTKESVLAYMRQLFVETEDAIIGEIIRKRARGYVDYAEVATLDRIQKTLQKMVDKSWIYIPRLIDRYFYSGAAAAAGYANAKALSAVSPGRMKAIELLTDNLLGEIREMSQTALNTSQRALADLGVLEAGGVPVIGTTTQGVIRIEQLRSATKQLAGSPGSGVDSFLLRLRQQGITSYVDQGGREWSMRSYGYMATRTAARQAQVAGVLYANPEQDLYMISRIGSTCPICAPLEGRVYSKSGMDPNYPPLAAAFGKIDVNGPDDLSNTYLNIHPNCLHSLIPYTELGRKPGEVEKMRRFSSFEENPITHDPRSKKQIEAYREKQRQRAAYLREFKRKQAEKLQREFEKEAAKASAP
jgi:hypothetical protein